MTDKPCTGTQSEGPGDLPMRVMVSVRSSSAWYTDGFLRNRFSVRVRSRSGSRANIEALRGCRLAVRSSSTVGGTPTFASGSECSSGCATSVDLFKGKKETSCALCLALTYDSWPAGHGSRCVGACAWGAGLDEPRIRRTRVLGSHTSDVGGCEQGHAGKGGWGIAVRERQIQLRKIAGNCGEIAVPPPNPPKPQGAASLHRGHTGHQHARTVDRARETSDGMGRRRRGRSQWGPSWKGRSSWGFGAAVDSTVLLGLEVSTLKDYLSQLRVARRMGQDQPNVGDRDKQRAIAEKLQKIAEKCEKLRNIADLNPPPPPDAGRSSGPHLRCVCGGDVGDNTQCVAIPVYSSSGLMSRYTMKYKYCHMLWVSLTW